MFFVILASRLLSSNVAYDKMLQDKKIILATNITDYYLSTCICVIIVNSADFSQLFVLSMLFRQSFPNLKIHKEIKTEIKLGKLIGGF